MTPMTTEEKVTELDRIIRRFKADDEGWELFPPAWETGKRHWRNSERRCAWSQIM